jgi:hypothetical protein
MLDVVARAINLFYIEKKYDAFKEACMKPLPLFEELKKYMELHGLNFVEKGEYKDYPSKYWFVYFEDYKKNELEISYETMLYVSKVTPLFYIQHHFSVKNKDKNGFFSDLKGIDNATCIKQQFDLNNEMIAVLCKNGYQKLELAELNEAVPGFKMPEELVYNFGPNITVDHLLFMDLLNISDIQFLK